MKTHLYETTVVWQGNLGKDTKSYTAYSRDHLIQAFQKPPIPASSDPDFLGDPLKYNPEELFLSSLSSCHMLWYLHLCSQHGVQVVSYSDCPQGIMEEYEDGSGKFTKICLHPRVTIRNKDHSLLALKLHGEANRKCFIANSCNFKIEHLPEVTIFTDVTP